jgi:signal transduction histidine kinase
MYRHLLLLFFCTGALVAYSQTQKRIDSLLAISRQQTSPDTNKVKLLLQIGELYKQVDLAKTVELATEALSVAQQIDYPLGQALAYYTQGAAWSNMSKFEAALDAYQKALLIYTQQKRYKSQVRMANNIGGIYFQARNYSKAKEYYERASEEAEQLGDKRTQGEALVNLGNVYGTEGNHSKTIDYYKQAIELFESLGEKNLVMIVTGNLGSSYQEIGEYKQALDLLFEAKRYHEQQQNTGYLAMNNGNIARIYDQLNDWDNALKYYQETLKGFVALKNTYFETATLNNIANVYDKLGNYAQAIEYNSQVLIKGQKVNDNYRILNALLSMCEDYARLGDFHKAVDYWQKALKHDHSQVEKDLEITEKTNSAYLFRVLPDSLLLRLHIAPQTRYSKAETALLRALAVTQELNKKTDQIKVLNELSLLYEQQGDFVKAYDTFKKKIDLNESIIQEATKKQIARKDIQYDFDKKEAELRFQQQLTSQALEKQKLLSTQQQQALLLKNQALTLSKKDRDLQRLAYLQEKAEKQKREQALHLAQQGKQLQASQLLTLKEQKAIQVQTLAKQNALIGFLAASLVGLFSLALSFNFWQRQKRLKKERENSSNFTKQLLLNTEAERKRIASDLHDSISHELLGLKQNVREGSSEVPEKIDSIINDIRNISRNLHPVLFEQLGLVANIESLVLRLQQSDDFFVHTELHYSGTLKADDELQLYRILQEALNNTIKYAHAHAAKITLRESAKQLLLEIRDNGQGFDVVKTLNSGKAFGLHNIIERAKAMGGIANIEASNTGTIIKVYLPI